MAPNKRGGPISGDAAAQALREASVISAAEIAARGSGTSETADSYKGSCRDELRVFLTGLMFLTRLPCPAWCDHHPAFLMRSMCYFPVIGAIIGAWGGVFYKAAVVLLPASVSAGVSTLATVWLTGCFHEDGLSDCFDGFGGGWGRKQILNIMKDSRVGTYALAGMVLVLHQKLAALAAFDWQLVAPIMIAAHCASRWSSSVLTYCCTYIQDEEDAKKGLYNWFADSQRLLTKSRLAFCTATAVVIPLLMIGLERTLIVWATLAVVTVASGLYGTAIIGGVVGDYLGATIQVAELCIYLALLADWSVLFDGSGAWKQIAALLATIALPVIYTRKIVDFGAKKS